MLVMIIPLDFDAQLAYYVCNITNKIESLVYNIKLYITDSIETGTYVFDSMGCIQGNWPFGIFNY